MNIVAICLHCLDMRDFHSELRDTPFLDELRKRSIFVPMGRGQGHHQRDSLNAEMIGQWTARFCDSELTEKGYRHPEKCWLPKTVLEYLRDADYELLTCIGTKSGDDLGTAAVECGMKDVWLADAPERLAQFNAPSAMDRAELLERIRGARRFYAHLFLRDTHRPWGQTEGLCALAGMPPGNWPEDAYCARKAALEKPDEFAALRRRGLARADRLVAEIFEAIRGRDDVAVAVYSNHGEVFDHFRYHLPYRNEGAHMIRGTSHGPYPYEVLYANMQMWVIPGRMPRVVRGIGRSIDFAPTVLQLAGVHHPPMDGESMLPHFEADAFPARDRYAESGPWGALSMVRCDGVKLISTGIAPSGENGDHYGPDYHRLAVFDLLTDPWEYVNIVDTPRGQEVLTWALARHRELGVSPPDDSGPGDQ